MAKTTRWGILGTGSICGAFAEGLKSCRNGKLVAVGSRKQKTADAFAERFKVANSYGAYKALVADPNVDAIYIGSPHHMHCEHTLLCLNAGKAVLCEKPFAINAREAKRMIDTARRKKVFLMEAMWSRFLPSVVKTRELVKAGAIGKVRMITGDFGFRAGIDPKGRLFNPAMGGGGLMDVGVYVVSLANMFLGETVKVASLAEMCRTGVDGQACAVMKYTGGELAMLATGVRTTTPAEARILGTDGYIEMHQPWWCNGKITVHNDKGPKSFEPKKRGNGYQYQAEEVGKRLAARKLESKIMPWADSLATMKTMDAIRAEWPLQYPMEKKVARKKTAKKAARKKASKK